MINICGYEKSRKHHRRCEDPVFLSVKYLMSSWDGYELGKASGV